MSKPAYPPPSEGQYPPPTQGYPAPQAGYAPPPGQQPGYAPPPGPPAGYPPPQGKMNMTSIYSFISNNSILTETYIRTYLYGPDFYYSRATLNECMCNRLCS